MKTYGDLNLKALRIEAGIDFAHFTYKDGMCSCCYGPQDLPKRYWKDGNVIEEGDFSYILFKNANNGSGTVTKTDRIEDFTYIEHSLSDSQMEKVIELLQGQLGEGYVVNKPKSEFECIEIRTK